MINKEEILIKIIILISTNVHMVRAASATHSVLHLPSANPSACPGSLPDGVTQIVDISHRA